MSNPTIRIGLLALLIALLTGCGGGSDSSPLVTVAPSSGGGAGTPPAATTASALLLFELTEPNVVLARIADQATAYRITAIKAGGEVVKTTNTPRVERLQVNGLPAGPTLLRTEFLNGAGEVIGYLDRFTTLVAGQTAVLSLSGFVTGVPPQGVPVFPAMGTAPAQLVFTSFPTSVSAGAPFRASVLVLDAQGAPVGTAQGSVTLSSSSPGLSGSTTAPLVAGSASFDGLTTGGAEGSFTLRAVATMSGQTLQAESLPISRSASGSTPNAGTPASLRFVSVPSTGTAGLDLSTVEVEVLDVYGQRVQGSGLSVALTLSQNPLPPEGAVLSGSLTQSSTAGLAAFAGVRLDRAGSYRLNASAAGVVGASSTVFTVSAAPPEPSVPGTGLFDGVMVFARTVSDFDYEQHDQPRDVLSGDFDGDGKLDLVMVTKDWSGGEILLAQGKGDGTFHLPVGVNTALRMETAASADLDGDGDLDLVATSFEAGGIVRPYFNDGTGAFSEQPALVAGEGCFEVTLVDTQGDGSPDIVTVNRDAGTVAVFSNAGDGTFSPRVISPVDPMPVGVATGDLDGDGDMDLAVAHVAGGTVSLLENSAGTFAVRSTVAMGDGAFSVLLYDLDGDARPDLVTSDRDAGTVTVRLRAGNFAFGAAQTLSAGQLPSAVKPGDFNNDGQPDLAVANFGEASVTIFSQTPESWASSTVATGWGGLDLALGDFDGDGYLDFASGNYHEGSVTVRLNDAMGGFRGPVQLDGANHVGSVLSGDLNGDGVLDLLLFQESPETFLVTLQTRFGTGQGDFVPGPTRETGLWLNRVELVDVDNDGDLDLVALEIGSHLTVHLNNGQGSFTLSQLLPTPRAELFTVGDLNSDGLSDLIWSSGMDDLISVHLGTGGGEYDETPVQSITTDRAGALALGDLNGDGRLDLLATTNGLSLGLGLGDGRFSPLSVIGVGRPNRIHVADLNRDGFPDIVTHTQHSLTTWLNSGTATFLTSITAAPGRVGELQLLDMDGSGSLDVVTTNGESFPNGPKYGVLSFSIFGNSGDGSLSFRSTHRMGSVPPSGGYAPLAGGDFDGDGDIDLIGLGAAAPALQLWLNR